MFEPRSQVVVATLLIFVGTAVCAQQSQAPAPQGQPQVITLPAGQQGQLVTVPGPQGPTPIVIMQGQPPSVPPPAAPVTPPEIVAAEAEAATRRYEAGIDLNEVIAEVARSSGKEFLIDPRVRARIYSVPQIENPTYPVLLSVLRLNGYIAVEIGGKVNIMPDANARSMPTRLLQRDDSSVPDDEVVTRVITVPNAAMFVPILRPLMPQHAHLAAWASPDQPNKLIVTDTYANVRRITELVETLGQ